MPVGYQLTWLSASTNLGIGETTQAATYNYRPNINTINTLLGGIATATDTNGYIELTGVSAGTVSIPSGTSVGNSVTTSNATTVTVTAPAEDESYLNKRGLTHFWENIDEIKQDKLTAGANITIAADNTISASQPTVNDATLTIQKNGTTVNTFTANASSNVTANISVPTKTSDLTNDGSDNTSTYIETDDAQKFAIGQGSTNPVFDEMTPVKTIEWDVTDQTYRPIYQMANTGWTYINMDITVAYRITVTGTNIHSVTDIVDRWHNPISYPITSMFCRTLSNSGGTTGLRYLRAVYPMSAYLNNASYPLGTEIAMYNSTARHVKIEVFKDNSQVTWNTTKPSGPIYVSGTYNNNNVMSAYDTRGWKFRQPSQMYASNAGYAEYISNFEPVNTAASELKNGATALAGGHYAFLADDGLVYDISNTAKNIAMCESKVGFMNSTVAANAAISYTYWRAISRPNATQVGYISHDTFALGNRVFLRCTMDSSGNVHSDNYLSTTMSAGYTWMPFGWARSATTLYVDTRFPMFYTLDANGKLTHINGKEVAGSGAASVAWGDITGKPTFATVATSGSYNDLTDKPVITDENYLITATSFSGSDGAYTFTADRTYAEIEAAYRAGKHLIVCADIYRVPDSGRPSTAHEYLYAELSRAEDSGGNDGPTFAFLATTASGSGRSITIWSHNFYVYGYAGDPYNAYSVDNASITVTDIISNSQNPISSNAVYTALAAKANTSSLSTVATSGSYNDLTNKPTIPTVNNGQLTIQKNGANVATFTANASSNVTADISVPTLYAATGQNTDGAVTQKLFTDTVGNVETILQTLNNGGGAQ